MPQPSALILRAPGTNCDEETARAWELAGARATILHVARLLEKPDTLDLFQIITIPGGFSYGDDLGAGRILASRLHSLGDSLARFRDRGGLILGICNGFQAIVRMGLLPGQQLPQATLARNDSGNFEARWVRLQPSRTRSPFIRDESPIELPVAHAEGKFLTSKPIHLDMLRAQGQIALQYSGPDDLPTQQYPYNPNGSPRAVAGVCDPSGQVFGLMPHPERFVTGLQHPRWTRNGLKKEGDGLRMFKNAVEALA